MLLQKQKIRYCTTGLISTHIPSHGWTYTTIHDSLRSGTVSDKGLLRRIHKKVTDINSLTQESLEQSGTDGNNGLCQCIVELLVLWQ